MTAGRPRARAIIALVVLAGAAAATFLYVRRGDRAPAPPAAPAPSPIPRVRLAELRHPQPGSLAGTVTSAGAPVATATVCARASDAARCAPTAANGAWALAELPPGTYEIWASAPGLGGGAWHGPAPELATGVAVGPGTPASAGALRLGAGEHRTGVDVVLLAGAVALGGFVRDVRGAPIAGVELQIRRDGHAPPTYSTHTSADGAFTAWAQPGAVTIAASADGFVDDSVSAVAPDDNVAIVLTPGGSVAGVVIDAATRKPIADVDIDASGADRTRTDAAGRFRLAKLRPGRYKPTATSIGGYGEAPESVLVGLGQAIDGVVIEIHPVAVVAGRIVIDDGGGAGRAAARPCPADQGEVWLNRYGGAASYFARTLDDGVVLLEGVVPGSYGVSVRCRHWLPQAAYPDVIVGDSDVEDLTWRVSPGARIAGHVRARTGEPIAGAAVNLRVADGVSFASATTDADGAFSADGLGPGAASVDVSADGFLPSRGAVTVQAVLGAGAPATCEVILDRGGAIAGVVVDARGQPVAGVHVLAQPAAADSPLDSGGARADRGGAFRIEPMQPGAYRVTVDVAYGDALVASTSVEVAVALDATSDVRLVASMPDGAIEGTVVDGAGAPIADAYVTAAREDDAGDNGWRTHYTWTSPSVLAARDGRFRIGGVPPGHFGVRAVRPGGGEAVVSHVVPGSTVTVAIRPTGVLAGVVAAANGAPVTDVVVSAKDYIRDISRDERAYFTGGRFALRDLPAGNYKVTVDGDPVSATMIALADGERREDLRLVAQPRYTLHGRLVSGTGAPLAAWKIEVPRLDSVDHGTDGRFMETATIDVAVTASDGTFVVHDLPATPTTISVFDVTRPPDAKPALVRDVTPAGAAAVVEVGDLVVP